VLGAEHLPADRERALEVSARLVVLVPLLLQVAQQPQRGRHVRVNSAGRLLADREALLEHGRRLVEVVLRLEQPSEASKGAGEEVLLAGQLAEDRERLPVQGLRKIEALLGREEEREVLQRGRGGRVVVAEGP